MNQNFKNEKVKYKCHYLLEGEDKTVLVLMEGWDRQKISVKEIRREREWKWDR